MTADADARVDRYLRTLRRRLRGFGSDEAREIAAELRSHIVEKMEAGADLESVLGDLGTPDELAGRYIADHVLASAEVSRSPVGVLYGVFRWATLSGVGSIVLVASVAGYFTGAALLLCAVMKPFHPNTAGLWTYRDEISLRMGFGTLPAGATDLLGWWIVPVGLAAGALLIAITTSFALWCVRRARAALGALI